MSQTLRKLNNRLVALVMIVALLLCAVPAMAADEFSGKCGKNLSWRLEEDTLIITGSGAMEDYREQALAPWHAYRERITAVLLPDGLTHVGRLAFYQLTALEMVFLPDSVQDIGWHAFDGCTALTVLHMGSGVTDIQDGAFQNCTSLKAVRLPASLISIGYQAFSRCEALTEITIPASVTNVGMAAFSFCYNLVRANIQARITILPEWTFYGCARLTDISLPEILTGASEYAFYECESLTSVEYHGSEENKEQIKSDIVRDIEGIGSTITVSDIPAGDSTTNSTFEQVGDGVISQTTTTSRTENASISANITVHYPQLNPENSSSSAQVDITLENSEGWKEVADYLHNAVGSAQNSKVDVYVKDDSELPGEVLDLLAGKDAVITVHGASGSQFKIDCSDLYEGKQETSYTFSYQRTVATDKQQKLLGGNMGYQIHFDRSAQINAQVMVRLGADNSRKIATLYQVDGGELTRLQSVVIGNQGYAHFYLASVDKDTEYLIGINMPDIPEDGIIVPEEFHGEYGITDPVADIEYVLTGRTSSWGMSIGQVTLIMVGVMVACVACIGVVMMVINKRKLKAGYVPDLGEEDSEE